MFGRKAKKRENINPDLKNGMLVNYEGEPYADYTSRTLLEKFDNGQKQILTAALGMNGIPVKCFAFIGMSPIIMSAMCLVWQMQEEYDDIEWNARVPFTEDYLYEIGQVCMADYPYRKYCRDGQETVAAAKQFVNNAMMSPLVVIYKAGCPLFEMIKHPHIKAFDPAVMECLVGCVRARGYNMKNVEKIIAEFEKTWDGESYRLNDEFQLFTRKCCYEERITVNGDRLLNHYVNKDMAKSRSHLPGELKKDFSFDRASLGYDTASPVHGIMLYYKN